MHLVCTHSYFGSRFRFLDFCIHIAMLNAFGTPSVRTSGVPDRQDPSQPQLTVDLPEVQVPQAKKFRLKKVRMWGSPDSSNWKSKERPSYQESKTLASNCTEAEGQNLQAWGWEQGPCGEPLDDARPGDAWGWGWGCKAATREIFQPMVAKKENSSRRSKAILALVRLSSWSTNSATTCIFDDSWCVGGGWSGTWHYLQSAGKESKHVGACGLAFESAVVPAYLIRRFKSQTSSSQKVLGINKANPIGKKVVKKAPMPKDWFFCFPTHTLTPSRFP